MLERLKGPTIAVVSTFALLGCANTDLNVSVKEQWTESISNFSLRAVYPMRENVHIGTVRLISTQGEFFGGQSRSYGQINVSAYLSNMLNNLPTYAPTNNTNLVTAVTSGDTTYEAWVQPTVGATREDRLRLATLPGISVVSLTSADFAVNSPLQALSGAFQERNTLDIQLSAIETIEMDDITAFRVFETAFWGRLTGDIHFRNALCRSASAMRVPDGQDVQLQMITRVFYARAVDYAYSDKSAAALRAVTGGAVATTVNLDSNGVTLTDETEIDSASVGAPEAQPGSPSAAGNIGTETSQGFRLREVFQRPLAFGIDAIAIEPYALGMRCMNGEFNVLEGSEMHIYLSRSDTASLSGDWGTVNASGQVVETAGSLGGGMLPPTTTATETGPAVAPTITPPISTVPFGTLAPLTE